MSTPYSLSKDQRERFEKNLPHVQACFPKGTGLIPCQTCGYPTDMQGTSRCNNCWEVENRLDDYLRSSRGCGRILMRLMNLQPKAKLKGTYVGPEEQFKGRTADCDIWHEVVMAQFDEGEIWETHSRLTFPLDHWKFEESDG